MFTFDHKVSMKRGGAFILLIGALLCVSSSAFASGEHEHAHGDILLTVDEVTGELAIGSVSNQTTINELEGTTIAEVELQGIFGLDDGFTASEPGFSSGPYDVSPNLNLPANTDLEFGFLHIEHDGVDSNLLFWDFSGVDPTTVDEDDVSFAPAVGHTLTVSDISNSAISTSIDGSGSDVEGFVIGTTSGTGTIHEDLTIDLVQTGGVDPAAGIYLWKMEFELGSAHSDPIYWLGSTVGVDTSLMPPFDYSNIDPSDAEDVEEAFEELMEAAEHYVAETFAGEEHDHGAAVPEPSTLAMTLMGLIGAFACVRRRRNLI